MNPLIRNPVSLWTGNILEAELETIEARLASCINGDDGSAHAPLVTIAINRSGLTSGIGSFYLTGPLLFQRAAGHLLANSFSTAGFPSFLLEDGDYFELAPGNPFRSHTLMHDVSTARCVPSYHFVNRADGGLQAYSPVFDLGDGSGPQPGRAYVPIRAHDGSTMTGVTVYFRVGAPHLNAPSTFPAVRVLRQDADGNVVVMTSKASGGDASGYVYVPTPSTVTGWYANGASQSLSVTCDQNNIIDVSQYAYFVELVDENGIQGFPWSTLYKATVSAVVNQERLFNNAYGADGVAIGIGDRVLSIESPGPGLDILGIVDYWTQPTNYPLWSASTQYAVGDVITPSTALEGLFSFRCIQAGQTSGTQPTWSEDLATSYPDGAVVWVANGECVPAVSSPSSDMAKASDFKQGMVVRIGSAGTAFGDLDMQANPSLQSWPGPSVYVPGYKASTPLFVLRTPASAVGLIWDGVQAIFTGITDLRPQ